MQWYWFDVAVSNGEVLSVGRGYESTVEAEAFFTAGALSAVRARDELHAYMQVKRWLEEQEEQK